MSSCSIVYLRLSRYAFDVLQYIAINTVPFLHACCQAWSAVWNIGCCRITWVYWSVVSISIIRWAHLTTYGRLDCISWPLKHSCWQRRFSSREPVFMTPRQWQCADIITAQHQMLCMLSYWWATVLDLCQHLMAVTTVHHWHMHMIQLHRVCQVLHGYCITINCSALHCTALQGVRLHCTIIQCIALRCVTTHCSAPHNIALRCMVVLCAAARTHISVPAMLVLQYSPWDWGSWPILVIQHLHHIEDGTHI